MIRSLCFEELHKQSIFVFNQARLAKIWKLCSNWVVPIEWFNFAGASHHQIFIISKIRSINIFPDRPNFVKTIKHLFLLQSPTAKMGIYHVTCDHIASFCNGVRTWIGLDRLLRQVEGWMLDCHVHDLINATQLLEMSCYSSWQCI